MSAQTTQPEVIKTVEMEADETLGARAQTTYVWQRHGAFPSPYSGEHSLNAVREKSYSFTATLSVGARLWQGAEIYANPEVAQGVPLSNLQGLGGFTNGEMARTSGPSPTLYRARLFARQTWGLGGERETVDADLNQLAGKVDKRRITLTVGNLAVTDIFDDNSYSHDPRKEFLNWSIMNHGAYDFAADARGYTWGAAFEYFYDDWAVRIGRFAQPKESNGQALDYALGKHYGDQIELERGFHLGDREGRVRLLAFRNVAVMGRYSDAMALAKTEGGTLDISAVRTKNQKRGFGVNVEQSLSTNLGAFFRASWADGKTETYAFTEIDRSMSGGLSLKGAAWGRGDDVLGLAMARNQLSAEHQAYLAAGGLGFFLGDGRLNYRPERIIETYYSAKLFKGVWLSGNIQRINNPGYNADRGPSNFFGVRLHAEYQ